jgi:nitrite reductase (NADH) small subunit
MKCNAANETLAMTQEWIEVGKIEEIPRLGARVVNSPLGDIAVFRNAKDELFALLDKCPHKGGPLSQGIVHDRSVTCPLHNWVLGLDDGAAKGPDEGCTKTFPIKQENGMVYLSLN